jgi:hypothetical protein
MTVRDEIRDPWSYVLSAFAGGLTWALLGGAALGGPVGLGVGAAVLGAKVVAGAFVRPAGPKRAAERRLPVAEHTDEAEWLRRAERAAAAFGDVARSAREGPIRERVETFGAETGESVAALARLAGQASAIRAALARIEPRRLFAERDRLLKAQRAGGDPAVLAERARSLRAVDAQLEGYQRLVGAINTLLARLESGTLGLEGLVARLAEVVALAETSVSAGGLDRVDELAAELEGLRAGLVETEGVTTRAMEGLPALPEGVPGSVAATRAERPSED